MRIVEDAGDLLHVDAPGNPHGPPDVTRRIRIQNRHLARHAAIARAEQLGHVQNVQLGILDSPDPFRARGPWVQHAVPEGLRAAPRLGHDVGVVQHADRISFRVQFDRAVRIPLVFPDDLPLGIALVLAVGILLGKIAVAPVEGSLAPLEDVRGVESPNELAHVGIAEPRARAARVHLAIHDRLAVGDRPQEMPLHQIAASCRRSDEVHPTARLVEVQSAIVHEQGLKREAGFRAWINGLDRRHAFRADTIEKILEKAHPFDVERGLLLRPLELADGIEVRIVRMPGRVQLRDIAVLLPHPDDEKRPRLGRVFQITRLVEQLVHHRLRPLILQEPHPACPHVQPELPALRHRQPEGEEAPPSEKRTRRRRKPFLDGEVPMAPGRRRVVHIERQTRVDPLPVIPHVRLKPGGVLRRFLGTVLVLPRQRHKRANRVEAQPLMPRVVGNVVVEPLDRIGVPLVRNADIVVVALVVERSHEVARLSADGERAVRRDAERTIGRHQRGCGNVVEAHDGIDVRHVSGIEIEDDGGSRSHTAHQHGGDPASIFRSFHISIFLSFISFRKHSH